MPPPRSSCPSCRNSTAPIPNIKVELIVGDRFEDIVASRFDAGIRFGERIDKDMIGLRIGPDIRARRRRLSRLFRPLPGSRRRPHDLADHDCVTYYMASFGGAYAWEFEEEGRDIEVKVSGSFMVNDPDMMIEAALSGSGLVYALRGFHRAACRQRPADPRAGGLLQALQRLLPLLSEPATDAAGPFGVHRGAARHPEAVRISSCLSRRHRRHVDDETVAHVTALQPLEGLGDVPHGDHLAFRQDVLAAAEIQHLLRLA